MRLIGNKTKLLPHIEGFLADRGVEGGTFLDIFSGSASVGRHFKGRGFRVISNDAMSSCFTKAVAEVSVSRYPAFEGWRRRHAKLLSSRRFREAFGCQRSFDLRLGRAWARLESTQGPSPATPLAEAVAFLNHAVESREGLIFRNYAPGGPARRMYFTDDNARKIDGILETIREAHREGALSREELHLLLSSLLDAADRVANISGTYGAYLKSWQRSAMTPLSLEVPELLLSPLDHVAYQEDANALARRIKADVLYIDPPYTHRQYPANYHVLEILAEHHRVEDLEAYEASLYGKTGLRPYAEHRSLYCVRPSPRSSEGNVLTAMTDLILSSKAKNVLVSYNEEGLLSREELGSILGRFAGTREFDFDTGMRRVSYRRFRSDSDRKPGEEGNGKTSRRYHVIDGRRPDEVEEWLLFASRGRSKARVGKAGKAGTARTASTASTIALETEA